MYLSLCTYIYIIFIMLDIIMIITIMMMIMMMIIITIATTGLGGEHALCKINVFVRNAADARL